MVSVKFVIGTYGVASAYVLADTYDKASKVSIYFKLKEKIVKEKIEMLVTVPSEGLKTSKFRDDFDQLYRKLYFVNLLTWSGLELVNI